MSTAQHFALTLAVTLFALLASAQAQTPRMTTVNISAQSDKVHINVEGDVSELRVDVADESGDVVFQSGALTGQQLDWNMRDSTGERVWAGTYIVTVTFRTFSGKLRKRVEQVTVDEGEKASTKATPAAPEAVQVTVGKIAKFTSASTIGDSVITESAGNIGVGTTPQGFRLDVSGVARITPTTAGDIRFFTPNAETGMAILRSTNPIGRADVRFDGSTLKLLAGTGTTSPCCGIFISTSGKVGIGTAKPTNGKLDVVGGTDNGVSSLTTSGNGVVGTSNSGIGVAGSSTGRGIGVFGYSVSGDAGFFDGNVQVTGHLDVDSCTGCTMTSDQNLKTNFSTVNPRLVLDRLSAIPIKAWNYKSDEPTVRHIGPMAQDFRTAFNLGVDDKHIDMIDANGVTMASIQALYQMMRAKDRQIEQQELKNEAQSRQIEQLQVQLNQVKRTIKRKRAARR